MTVAYGVDPVIVDIDLTIEPGDMIGIVGPSGSGKSTLLKALLGGISPRSGTVTRRPDLTVGFVPQVERIDWNFPVTVAECVGHGARDRVADAVDLAARACRDRLGARPVGSARPRARATSATCPGGQQQRVFLARALFTGAEVIFLDEPTSGLDVKTRHEVLHLLADLNDEGVTVVLSTHDLNGIATHLPTIVCLNKTVIGAGSPEDVLVPDVLERTYGSPMQILEHGGMRVVVDAGPNASVLPFEREVGA